MRRSRPKLERMTDLVDSMARAEVVVVGDAVLDEFEHGEISRVSREAPVLILEHRRTETVPGGAGNTAANLASLGVRTSIVGRVGDDQFANRLVELLSGLGVECDGLLPDPRYVTPTKTRILAGSAHTARQQIVRVDRGRRDSPPGASVASRLLARARRARRRGAAILLADYGYGVVGPRLVTELGPGRGPLTLDSRFSLSSFRGVDAATPNLEELERAVGRRLEDDDIAAIEKAGRELRARIRADAVLVTRGSRGMSLVEARRPVAHVPVFGSDEIADVTGAGDTVIATFTAARAAGASWREAAELANVAGGLVVMKRGTATVSPQELVSALEEAW